MTTVASNENHGGVYFTQQAVSSRISLSHTPAVLLIKSITQKDLGGKNTTNITNVLPRDTRKELKVKNPPTWPVQQKVAEA